MDTKDTQEYAVNGGIEELRRPPRRDVEEILVVGDPEDPLKSERVEEALRAMPGWGRTVEGQAISHLKDLPTPEVASLYTAYVTGFAGSLGLPVAMSVKGGLVLVTVCAPARGGCMGELTESVLDFARQIG